ncbi:MAG: glycosyltransferase family 2 protein [Brevundimonas sp.]
MQSSSVSSIRVSVIMPARNAAPFIDAALQSVRAQSLTELEVLVIDDGSTDQTLAIAQRHASEYGRVRILHGTGRGPAAARNLGLAEARGQWAAVVDADDVVLTDRFERLLGAAGEAQIVADNLTAFYDDGATPEHPWLEGARWEQPQRLDLTTFLSSGRDGNARAELGYLKPMFRLAWLRQHSLRYDETLMIGEDFDFLARGLAAGATYVYAPHAGYRYRRRSGSISHRLTAPQLDAMIAAAERLAAVLDGEARGAMDARIARMQADRRFVVCVERMKSGDLSALAVIAGSGDLRARFGRAAVEGLTRRLRAPAPREGLPT